MPVASAYTKDNIINCLLRGVPFPVPAGSFLSLHTGDPGDTGANEATLVNWPSYVRRDANTGQAMGTGWSASANGQGLSQNANQILWPSMNGGALVQIGWFGVWDSASGGKFLLGAPLYAPKGLNPGDVFVFDVQSLTVREL
ncbi:hypothetical protein M0D69_13990 [Caballeronia sp. SEWSISQ10-4 2]|uniref:phage tail fiber protein n=1 Tax=Caballeronia sp. SEWSISQ10-4 2 TaxID=2937438 RepID=UPI002650EECE|nr:hypothetical protein [Caballeronia sp. SEWSISQ10-4 2]MDN7179105.1 hypothetical protein [Caballeronia sp. SEWSISQ10-4 2]